MAKAAKTTAILTTPVTESNTRPALPKEQGTDEPPHLVASDLPAGTIGLRLPRRLPTDPVNPKILTVTEWEALPREEQEKYIPVSQN
jgi:hypothetical protein